jgi:hypothetical protein
VKTPDRKLQKPILLLHLVDSMLSKTRDMDAAQRFFRQARAVTGP